MPIGNGHFQLEMYTSDWKLAGKIGHTDIFLYIFQLIFHIFLHAEINSKQILKFYRIKQSNQKADLIAGLRAPVKVQAGQWKYKVSLIEPHMILWKMWSKEWQIWLSGAIPKKSVLWVCHRIRRIRNQTSDEEVIKKRKLRNQKENEENGNDNVDGLEMKEK